LGDALGDGGGVAGSDHLMTDGGVEGVTILDLSSPVPRTLDHATLVLDVTEDGRLPALGQLIEREGKELQIAVAFKGYFEFRMIGPDCTHSCVVQIVHSSKT
jgi:predicted flavoprotein YhiN